MRIGKSILVLSCAIIFSFLSTQNLWAQNAAEEPSMVNRLLAARTVAGAWQLNSAESDEVISKMQEKMSNLTSAALPKEKGDAESTQLPSLSVSLFPPESLILAEDSNESAITINEGFTNVLLTRTFPTDGNSQSYELSGGANFTVKAMQQRGKVIVETFSPRGNKMIETYELAASGNKLYVTLRVVDRRSNELFTLHRVYERAAAEVFPAAENEDSEY